MALRDSRLRVCLSPSVSRTTGRGLQAVLAVGLLLATASIAQASDPVYDANGAQYGRGYFAPLPFEHIDTVTGNVWLSFTDLVLPGNAGFNLSVVRTYNSRDARWRFGIGNAPLLFTYASGTDLSNIDFITADGAKHNASGGGAQTMTQEFWQFTKSTYTLEMPNGLVATYGHVFGTYGRYLTELRDPFDNVITFQWETGTDHLQQIAQWLNGGARYISFDAWAGEMCASMSYDTRVWSYYWTSAYTGPIQLTGAAPPGGARWDFAYTVDSQSAVKIASLITPNGAQVAYTWAEATFPTTPANRVAISTRTASGNVPAATWSFDWQNTGRRLVLTGPVNKVTYDTLVVNDVPVGSSRTVATLGGTTLDSESLTYTTIPNPVNDLPALATAVVTRDGRTFTTTYGYSSSNYADYGQPNQITEAGELTRTTAITYTHAFSKYIRGRVASMTATVGGQSFGSSSTYDSTTGFRTSSTAFGTTTSYTDDGYGNTGVVRDATSRTTAYTYQWGAVKRIDTSAGSVVRTLNNDGSVATETMGSTVTTYGYDAAGRVTSVNTNTSGRQAVTTAYTISGSRWVGTTTTRGATSVTTDVDGYGRAIHAQDSTGVQSRTTYDAGGRVTYRSRPYGTGVAEVGNTYTYDALNRPLVTTRNDGSTVTTAYSGTTTSVTESVSSGVTHTTTQAWQAFGSPADARLVSVTDAKGGTFNYTYDAPGNLRSVDSTVSGGATRTWTYNSFNQLTSATQPESGSTSFAYDAAGRLDGTTDARGVSVTYGFDAAGRPSAVDAPGTTEDVTTTYDANGNVAGVVNGTVQTTLSYDTAHRVTASTDLILGHPVTQTFAYDGLDNLISAAYPLSGRTVFYDYDTQGRLTAVRTSVNGSTSQTLANTFVYRGDGALVSYAYGNGLTASTGFDSRQRPTHWVNGPLDITYAYDHVGNVTGITDARGSGQSSTFTYDELDRLSTVSGFGATSFTYNGAGDRLTQGTIGFTYNTQHQLATLTGSASGSFTYDAAGSLLSDPSGTAYAYSSLSALKSSTLSGQTTTYAYGPDGGRAVKTGPDGVPHLFVRGPGGLIAEYTAYGADLILVREYAYLGGQLLASFTPSAVTPPALTATILTPTNGQTMTSGSTLTLTASATAGSGLTIARVEYYVRGVYIGAATSAPYTVPWINSPMPPGSYLFTARVVSTDNHAVASAPVTIAVQ